MADIDLKSDDDTDLDEQYQAKTRLCLMCREPFESAWAGERVCKRCKSTAAWREG